MESELTLAEVASSGWLLLLGSLPRTVSIHADYLLFCLISAYSTQNVLWGNGVLQDHTS